MRLQALAISALLLCAAGVADAEDRVQRPSKRGRAPGRRSFARKRGSVPPVPAEAVPFWASVPVGIALGAVALPFSPVYAAVALGVTQTPGSRMLLGRAASAINGFLGLRRPLPPREEVTIRSFARALNNYLPNIVEELDQVPVFLVVDESGNPLKVAMGEDMSTNLTFAYLEYADAQILKRGLRTQDGEPVETTKIIGTSLGSVVRSYLEKRDQNGTDEMLIMPSNIEVKTAEEIMAQMGGGSPPQIVPNSVPIYHVEGLPASEDEASAGAEGAAPPAALSFFRFSDMRNRIESLKEALKANGTADAKPELRVRMMRLHELSQLTGTERMPGKPHFIPSTTAVTDLAAMRASADGSGTPSGPA